VDAQKRTKKKDFKNVAVKYVTDWKVEFENEEPVFLADYGYKDIVRSHTKRYHNCLYLLAGLSMCARNLMDFMCEEMNDENIVYTNAYFRNKFVRDLSQLTNEGVSYSDASVKRALTTLGEKGLIRHIQRGACRINPKYFWKNDDKDRTKRISIELNFEHGSDTKLKVLQGEYGVDTEIKR
jgi:hypothetical protein